MDDVGHKIPMCAGCEHLRDIERVLESSRRVIAEQAAPAGEAVAVPIEKLLVVEENHGGYQSVRCILCNSRGWRQHFKHEDNCPAITQQPADCKRCAELEKISNDWKDSAMLYHGNWEKQLTEITILQAKVAELTDRLSVVKTAFSLATGQIAELTAERDQWRIKHDVACDTIERMKQYRDSHE